MVEVKVGRIINIKYKPGRTLEGTTEAKGQVLVTLDLGDRADLLTPLGQLNSKNVAVSIEPLQLEMEV